MAMAEPFTVLFVEDDPGVRASTERLLASKGLQLLVARDASRALHLLEVFRVDVLFTDIVMPDIDGIALAKQAKLLQPEIKLLFMTGYYSRATDATRLGKLLFKPVREPQILEAVRELMMAA